MCACSTGTLSTSLQGDAEPGGGDESWPEVQIADPGCPEAATLVTDGSRLAVFDEHAVCLARFLLEQVPATLLNGVSERTSN